MSWIAAFALTQALELPVYGWLLRPVRLSKRLWMGAAASAATHPWVWFVLPPYLQPTLGYWGYVAVVEVLVVLAEAGLLAGFGVPGRRALVAALAANALSVTTGLLLTRLIR